jgi:hypothetical protein
LDVERALKEPPISGRYDSIALSDGLALKERKKAL